MECLEVRERLTGYALSTLGADERSLVEEHLTWCAGCRKEAGDLQSGAATVGLALMPVEPPSSLEERVVRRITSAASRRAPGRRRLRILIAATVSAAVVASVAVGWGAVMASRAERSELRAARAEAKAEDVLGRLRELLEQAPFSLGEDHIRQARLIPGPGHQGGGAALVVTSPRKPDFLIVILAGLPRGSKALPYQVDLVGPTASPLPVGTIRVLDADGGAELFREFKGDLGSFTNLVVRDPGGEVVLRGWLADRTIRPSA